MGSYAVLGGLAALTLSDLMLIAVLIFLAGLALKTLIAAKRRSLE
jgi:hypothetical protein